VEALPNLDEKSNGYAMINSMAYLTLTTYFQQESKTLNSLLLKLNQLALWNSRLRDALPDEPLLTEHCHIVGLDKAALIVIADNPHWVTRFRFFIPDLLIKLRHHPDLKQIQAICCKVKPLYNAAPKKIRRQRLTISKNTADVLQSTAHKIQDKKLKAVLKKIAERSF